MSNNIEKDIEIVEKFKNNKLERDKLEINDRGGFKMGEIYKLNELNPAISNILSDRERLLKEKEDTIKVFEQGKTALRDELKNILDRYSYIKPKKEQDAFTIVFPDESKTELLKELAELAGYEVE